MRGLHDDMVSKNVENVKRMLDALFVRIVL